MGKVQVATAVVSGRNLPKVAKHAYLEAESKINGSPDFYLYFPGVYSVSKKVHQDALSKLSDVSGKTSMAGGVMCGNFDNSTSALQSVGVIAFKGIDFDMDLIKRVRVRSQKKALKYLKKRRNTDKKSNEISIFIAPGPGFPKVLANMLLKVQNPNPMFFLNFRAIRWFSRGIRSFGPLMNGFMNYFGIGMPGTSLYSFFVPLFQNNFPFLGGSTGDSISLNKPMQFFNYQVDPNALVSLTFKDESLKLSSAMGMGASFSPDSIVNIENYIPSGFITQINRKWPRDALLEKMNIDHHTFAEYNAGFFYFDVFHPLCITDPSKLDNDPCVLLMSANPNLKISPSTIPDQILAKLKKKELKAYFGVQSAQSILGATNLALNKAIESQKISHMQFGLIFECALRAGAVGDGFKRIVEAYRDFFDDVPFLGILSGGEITSQPLPIVNASTVVLLGGY